LGRLDKGLSGTELAKLENLFGRCGSFYAQRKALMLSRLGREVEVYITLVEQLKTLTSSSAFETYKVDGWKQLVEQEKVQSELFSSLVVQQDAIISTLISKKRSDSEEMKAILQEVRETQESLLTANREAASTRATLIPL
jgi:cell division FtsZ-interacting protein ZapD